MARWWRRRRRRAYSYWDQIPRFEASTPREAKNGIKAKSRKGAIGETWWSKRFIALLESFQMGARLTRGMRYARSGQVMELEVEAGVVTSEVQGSRPAPYRVRIELAPLDALDWARVERALAERALFLAELLAGQMPQSIEEAFSVCGLSLFPGKVGELVTSCSCPDWANPCKHIAATYYILAERFDEDPFQIFAWRGRTREALVESLRALRGAHPARPASGGTDSRPADHEDAEPSAREGQPLPTDPDRFWRAGPRLGELRLAPRAAEVPDAILRELGPLDDEPEAAGSLDALLRPLYLRLAAGAARRALEQELPSSAPELR
jgi:uncharacterized Zn finger protein